MLKNDDKYLGLRLVISGGQLGADQGGLAAAKACGIPTGGHAPKGYRTKAGPMPSLHDDYGLVEHVAASYTKRTEANVMNSDATVRLAYDFQSGGEKATLRYIQMHHKPYLDIKLLNDRQTLGFVFGSGSSSEATERLIMFIEEHKVQVLNVAGNCEIAPYENRRIFNETVAILLPAFRVVKGKFLLPA